MFKTLIWIDDVRDPKDYCADHYTDCTIWCKSVNEAIAAYSICQFGQLMISLDHDAGDYASDGGDFIRFLDWMEQFHRDEIPNICWEIHTMNPVGAQNMRAILRKNGVNC